MKVVIIMHDHEQWHEITGPMPFWKGFFFWWYLCLKWSYGHPSIRNEINCFWIRRVRKNKMP